MIYQVKKNQTPLTSAVNNSDHLVIMLRCCWETNNNNLNVFADQLHTFTYEYGDYYITYCIKKQQKWKINRDLTEELVKRETFEVAQVPREVHLKKKNQKPRRWQMKITFIWPLSAIIQTKIVL